MTGVVTDASGALVPDTAVVLANPHTGVSFTTKTDSKGSYRFSNVPPGPGYTVTFTHDGFANTQINNLELQVANTRTQDARLQVGAAQTVEVSASGQDMTINTTDATVGNNISPEVLNELPVLVRDTPSALFTLQPGVTTGGTSITTGSITGSRTDQTQVTVDGLDVNDLATGQPFSIVGKEPVDATQEFRGTVSGFAVDNGPGAGGQYQLVTKSGTNQFHGNINEYHRDAAMASNFWFNNNSHIRKPNYIRNQFGGNIGGPLKHNKAFVFFNLYDSRILQSAVVNRTVPLDSFRAGNIGYVLAKDANGNTCTRTSRQNTTPQCIGFYTPAQVASLDPAGIGEDAAVFALINSRYPHANNVAGGGDGVNTGFYTFDAAEPDNEINYTGRLDYDLTSKHRIFGVATVNRENAIQGAPQFDVDGIAGSPTFIDRSYRWAAGDLWTISSNKVNQFSIGETVQDYEFPRPNLNPNGANLISFSGGTTSLMTSPYLSPSNAQGRRVPIPEVADNFQWLKGSHSIQVGGFFKYITAYDHTTLDYNSASIGLGGQVTGLNPSLRPSNILSSSTAANEWDTAFAGALGRIASISQQFNYNASGKALPLATGSQRRYRYYQSMAYLGDSWKVTPSLTLSYGVNWQYFSVPYETNGLESVPEIVNANGGAVPATFDTYFNDRLKAANTTGATAVPLFQYVLGGKANNGPAVYAPQWHDIAPRFAFSWNPSWDRNTVFRGGISMVYDRTVTGAVLYQQDQHSYLFQQTVSNNNGSSSNPSGSLATDPRVGAKLAYTAPNPPPSPSRPFLPFVDDAAGDYNGTPNLPYGLQNGGAFNSMIDAHLKTPYEIVLNFGMQHQFPAGFVLKMDYAGRLGRRLLGQADANQVLDNNDPKSSQVFSRAMANATIASRLCNNGAAVVADCLATLQAQPWFENVAGPGLQAAYGAPTRYKTKDGTRIQNWTSFLAYEYGTLIPNGDLADTAQALSYFTDYNVLMSPQFSEDTFYTNKGFSSYNGLLVTLHKNRTHGLAFEANYTFSHSIDNTSLIANQIAYGGYGFVCDPLHMRECRGNSDFDVTQIFNGWMNYQLPFGHGRAWANSTPLLLDEIIGGWEVSAVVNQHSGFAWGTVSNAFVPSYSNDAPAFFNGINNDVRANITKNSSGQVNIFSKGSAVANEFSGPVGFDIGPRNSLRGPGYFMMDAGLAKNFALWPERHINLQFRGDFYNVLNHPNFATPSQPGSNTDITNAQFGVITATTGPNSSQRIGQVSARIEF